MYRILYTFYAIHHVLFPLMSYAFRRVNIKRCLVYIKNYKYSDSWNFDGKGDAITTDHNGPEYLQSLWFMRLLS